VVGLALVRPAFGHGRANTVEAGESGDLTEPSTNKDGQEGLHGVFTRGENLTVGAGVELVRHDTSARGDTVQRVFLELGGARKLLQAQLRAPLGDGADVGITTGRRSSGRRWGGGSGGRGLAGGLRSGSVDSGGGWAWVSRWLAQGVQRKWTC
jgi:hypothetical protein